MSEISRLHEVVSTAVQALGYELWGIDLARGNKQQCLRIYIDSADGVNVDACAEVSRQVSTVLDVEEIIKGAYRLEVSSPGLDRPLFNQAHYERYVGQKIKLRSRIALQGRRNFIGLLKAVEDDKITLLLDNNQSQDLLWSQIEKANLVMEL